MGSGGSWVNGDFHRKFTQGHRCDTLPGMILADRRLALYVAFLFLVPYLPARVTHVDIDSRRDVLAAQAFGDSGPYERITGRGHFAVPVANIRNPPLVDLANPVNLQNGEVEFSADFVAVLPKDATKGNGTLPLENPNRGHSRILSLVAGGGENF